MVAATISIDVPDVSKATVFYTQALGCTALREPSPNWIVIAAGDLEIHLLAKEAGTCPVADGSAARSYERHWTPVHLDFIDDDVPGTVARVVEQGGSHEGGAKGEWGEIAHCADPFGNGFCVIRE